MPKRVVGVALVLLAGVLLAGCSAIPDPGSFTLPTQRPSSTPAVSGEVWTGEITYKFHEDSDQSGGGVQSSMTQNYNATIAVRFAGNSLDGLIASGSATVTADRSSLFRITVPCLELHTDEASASGSVQVQDGELQVSDGSYDLYVVLADLAGEERSVREYGCGGTKEDETHAWAAGAGGTIGGSGDLTNPNSISGNSTNGGRTTTWNLTRTP